MIHAVRRSVRRRTAAVAAAAAVCLGAAAGVPAFATSAPSATPGAELAADATDDARADLLAKEERYVSAAYSLDLQRVATVTPPHRGLAAWWEQDALERDFTYDIHAAVTRRNGQEVAYETVWTCQRSWKKPSGCNNFADRRDEFFAAALAKHREARAQLVGELGIDHLLLKNRLNIYRARPFFLVNNLTTHTMGEADRVVAGLSCLDVDGDPGAASEGRVQLMDCQIDRAASVTRPTDQVWRFVPGSGLVQNVASGRCLDVAGPAAEQVEHGEVVLSVCDVAGLPEHADQQWGLNPLGYLVNLSSGRCLDLTGNNQAAANGVGATVAACEYGYSGALDGLGSSSQGMLETDRRTDQSWSLWYVAGGMDDFLPAPAPPVDFGPSADPTSPSVRITVAAQRPAVMSAGVEFSVDETAVAVECRVDAGPFLPCTSPYETPRLTAGEHRITVNAADAAGDFTEADATVTVRVDTLVGLMHLEEELVRDVHDLRVQRETSETTDRRNIRYEISASATDLEGFAYKVDWACSRSRMQPNKCSNYEGRRAEFFTNALNAHREARAQIARFTDLDHLTRKNELNVYQGASFHLVNNQYHQCLDVRDRQRLNGVLQLSSCPPTAATTPPPPTARAWRFVPGTGLVQNILLGTCIDVEGSAAHQTDEGNVVLAPCPADVDAAEVADFQWALHPLGYLVNLASGRCLDMGIDDATKGGVVPPRVVACQYGYGAIPFARGSSLGLTTEDRGTDQSWSMSYVNGGMDDLLPAPPPPFDPNR